jgi:hypothetical protein
LAAPLDFSDVTGDFNYSLAGAAAVSGNQIKIQFERRPI